MMKFYFRGIQWDGGVGKALCEAKDGIFETDDPSLIEKLKERKIPCEENAEPPKPVAQGGIRMVKREEPVIEVVTPEVILKKPVKKTKKEKKR